jgi:hypothetical protein
MIISVTIQSQTVTEKQMEWNRQRHVWQKHTETLGLLSSAYKGLQLHFPVPKTYKQWSSIVTFIWDGNSVYILMWNLRCTANNTTRSWIIFRINADRKIIRRILYLFVPSFWYQTAVYIARVQGPNAAYGPYCFITPLEESYLSVVEVQSGICLKELVKQRNLERKLLYRTAFEPDAFSIHVTDTWNLYHLKFIWRNKRHR